MPTRSSEEGHATGIGLHAPTSLAATSDQVPASVDGALHGIANGTAATALPLDAVYNEFLA